MFDHQRLDVYGITLDFVIAADDIVEERHSAASDLLHSIVSMLTRLAKNKGG